MKKNRLSKGVLTLFFTVLLSVKLETSIAQELMQPLPFELKFVGMVRNKPVFQVNFKASPTGSSRHDEFNLVIKDQEGIDLYNEEFTGSVFTKKFLVDTDEVGDRVLRFEISSRTSSETAWYDVKSRNSRPGQWIIATNTQK